VAALEPDIVAVVLFNPVVNTFIPPQVISGFILLFEVNPTPEFEPIVLVFWLNY